MERIKLSKIEKRCFRHISSGLVTLPKGVDASTFYVVVVRLEHLGLVEAQYESGGVVFSCSASDFGRIYLLVYPSLRNPIRWDIITAVCVAVSMVVSIVALFVACSAFGLHH